jgi:hypothetical protein
MLKHINLQLFAEETIPAEKKETNLDNKPDEKKGEGFGSTIRNAFGLKPKEPEKKEETKPEDKKPDDKPEEKKEETPAPDTKEPEKKTEEPKADEFITIKHLGKEVKIPVSEQQKYLQMGYDYSHVKTEAENSKATLLRIAKVEGFETVDAYLAEIGNREKTKLAEKIEEAGGDPDKIDQLINDRIANHPKVAEVNDKERKLDERERAAQQEKIMGELKKDRFFKDLEPQFNDLMQQNPTVAPDLIYKIVKADHLSDKKIDEIVSSAVTAAVTAKEKSLMADIQDKERRAAPKGGDTSDGKDTVQPTAFTNKLAGIFGVSANKVAQRSHEIAKGR